MPLTLTEHSRLRPVTIPGVTEAYIVENRFLEEILFNRKLVGYDFSERCYQASKAFIQHCTSELEVVQDDISELMLLSKGFYYSIRTAYESVFNYNLEVNFMATKRATVTEDSIQINVPYFDFSARTSNLIVADTIASGETILNALSCYIQYQPIKHVWLFTIAGSVTGGQNIAAFCDKHNIRLTILYGLAAFGLADNGFDLSFLHRDTLTEERYKTRAEIMFYGKPVSAVGWDFGSQSQSITKYRTLSFLEAKYWYMEDTDVFLTDEPHDFRLVQKEVSAFGNRPDLISLINGSS
jgi:hypothetical protein